MNPEVVGAIIAASVSVVTLGGTLAAHYFGRRLTSRDTKQALEEQRMQLDMTYSAKFPKAAAKVTDNEDELDGPARTPHPRPPEAPLPGDDFVTARPSTVSGAKRPRWRPRAEDVLVHDGQR
jgi:hypothetical protein